MGQPGLISMQHNMMNNVVGNQLRMNIPTGNMGQMYMGMQGQ